MEVYLLALCCFFKNIFAGCVVIVVLLSVGFIV